MPKINPETVRATRPGWSPTPRPCAPPARRAAACPRHLLGAEAGGVRLRAAAAAAHTGTRGGREWLGIYKFRCPAVGEGTKPCNKQWSYKEVRRVAVLSVSEMRHFEETMARLAAADFCDIQLCPQCNTNVVRKDLSNLCVQCTICTADKKTTYQFCWQCRRKWNGWDPRSDRCNNDGCANKDLQLLQTCPTISLPDVEGATSCPSVRACPTCGMRVQHNQQHCKNIHCPRCQVPFCFLCLKLKSECNQTSSPYKICVGGVAPRQTSIPVWHRK
ncbi:E3 ubiquitin-protein ligase RNF19A-like isoform X1 [Platichthys flesus]|uniref:E3 ubiquitin-protein ligase RNF19A-like isoform X1 n=1 Tax=Platichthys flesus TaxID=8260 RepID=UPI002DB68D64|nr:E3 ubiquitin-protein ligase RNF19A-like isoform X1 [Platichthys flesus]